MVKLEGQGPWPISSFVSDDGLATPHPSQDGPTSHQPGNRLLTMFWPSNLMITLTQGTSEEVHTILLGIS